FRNIFISTNVIFGGSFCSKSYFTKISFIWTSAAFK
uniref:Uncharacterized protein n=1 Tax=Globisporangium ultimum (strain ATCC 200006 / CBS 805.95 / DAOM BR144) TaxID=431595 RepID=K3XCU9_GLOUD